jgi:hypothetical protein
VPASRQHRECSPHPWPALSIDRIEILLLIAPVVAIMVRRLHLFYTVGLTLASVALAFGHAPLAFALTKNFIFKAFLRFADSGRTEKKHRSNWLLKGSAGCKRNHATKTRHRSTPHLGRGYSRLRTSPSVLSFAVNSGGMNLPIAHRSSSIPFVLCDGIPRSSSPVTLILPSPAFRNCSRSATTWVLGSNGRLR